jgi:hypothetical protein
MCPACLADMTTLIISSGSLGGAAAFLTRRLHLPTHHRSEEEDEMATSTQTTHPVVSRDKWTAARKVCLNRKNS